VKPADSRAFLDQLIANSEKRAAVSGNLLVTTEVKGKSVTTPAVLLVKYPDQLRLELQDPVGGILALLVLNEGKFWFYRHDGKEILTGPLSAAPAGLLPAIDLPSIPRLFLARPDELALKKGMALDGKVTFHYDVGPMDLEEVSWKGDLAEPSEWKRITGDKEKITLLAQYDDYEFKSGVRYPTKIRLTKQLSGFDPQSALLAWKDWEPSVPESKKLFQIPQPETFGRKIKVLR
jgi:hypothetical protein